MKRNHQRATALLLTLLLLSCMISTASAAETVSSSHLGGIDDLSGYVVPDDEVVSTRSAEHLFPIEYDGGGVTYYLVFSIRAAAVTNLLPSSEGNKSFTLASLPSSAKYLSFRGTLYHAYQDGRIPYESIKYGVCHYNNAEEVYDCDYSQYTMSGYDIEAKFKISDYLNASTAYYTFVKNILNVAYVYGDLGLYYSSI